jgi:hypothetical protein
MLDRAAAQLTKPIDQNRDGITQIALYAYPNPGSGEPPIQLNGPVAAPSARPDVAAVYGPEFSQSGFDYAVSSLLPGTYDLAFFGFSVISQLWNEPVVVRVTVH